MTFLNCLPDLIVAHEMSFRGYNVFDPSLKSILQSCFFVCETPLKPLNRIW